MQNLGAMWDHVRLVAKMGQATQTDLPAAFARGDLSSVTWSEMVQTCRRCPSGETCEGWLDATEGRIDAPGFCANKALFTRLRALQETHDS